MKTYNLGVFGPVRTKEEIEAVAKKIEEAAIKAIMEDRK